MLELIRDWLFSAKQNRYIYRKLSPEKEIEIDIDGSVYMHLTYEYNPVHFRMLKNQLDSHFRSDGEYGDESEFYYHGDVTILSRDPVKNLIVLQLTCGNDTLLQAFLNWDRPTITNTMSFLRRYCEVL